MPIYEFQCAACGERHEELMRLSDPDPVECPVCHKPELTRLISAAGFRLKGAGWYETDFKSDKRKNVVDSKSSDSSSSDSSSASSKSSTETSSASKSESASSSSSATSTPAPAASSKSD